MNPEVNDIHVRTTLVTVERALEAVADGMPVFKVWERQPRGCLPDDTPGYHYRIETAEPNNHEVLRLARRNPLVTVIRSPHAIR
jgi:hypothetical protein